MYVCKLIQYKIIYKLFKWIHKYIKQSWMSFSTAKVLRIRFPAGICIPSWWIKTARLQLGEAEEVRRVLQLRKLSTQGHIRSVLSVQQRKILWATFSKAVSNSADPERNQATDGGGSKKDREKKGFLKILCKGLEEKTFFIEHYYTLKRTLHWAEWMERTNMNRGANIFLEHSWLLGL